MKNQRLTRESAAHSAPGQKVRIQTEESAFAERIKSAIGDEPVSAFGRRCGISEGTLRRYFAGSHPSSDNLVAIADAANVSIEWLAAGRGPKQRGAAQATAPSHAPAPAVQLDTRILTRAVTAVQEGLAGLKRPLPPDKHAALIMAAYELILEDEQQAAAAETTSARIVKFIKLAA